MRAGRGRPHGDGRCVRVLGGILEGSDGSRMAVEAADGAGESVVDHERVTDLLDEARVFGPAARDPKVRSDGVELYAGKSYCVDDFLFC